MFRRRLTSGIAALVLAMAALAPPVQSDDEAFPRSFESEGVTWVVRTPVVTDWAAFRSLHGLLPVESAGRAWRLPFEAETAVDFAERRVRLHSVRFGPASGAPVDGLAKALGGDLAMDLDALIAALPPDFEIPAAAKAAPQLNFAPPRIIVSEQPRRLMLIDGPPAMAPIDGTALEFVVNTDWDVFHDTRAGAWYVLDDGQWISSTLLSSGDWRVVTKLPDDFQTVQLNSDWPQVAAAMPP
ncbi:MAG: hypothetical protein P8Y54_06760, partial [Xanthomonadales bacterium]